MDDELCRNPFCPIYEDCLTAAAKRNISKWKCGECPLKASKVQIRFDRWELGGYLRLLSVVFGRPVTLSALTDEVAHGKAPASRVDNISVGDLLEELHP